MKQSIQYTVVGSIAALLIGLAPAGAEALTIAPAYADRTLNPGDSVIEALQVMNEQDAPATFYPVVMNFTSGGDEQGTPQFYPANEDPYGTALAKWVTVSADKVELAPKQRTSLLFTINIPDNARPGSYFGAVALSSSPPSAGGQVGVQFQLAELVLVTVTGNVYVKGDIAEFGFVKPQLWYEHLPVEFFLRFENSGNTHLRPTGELVISDWLGRQAATIKVNEEFKSVLPMSIRRFQSRWGDEVKVEDSGGGFWTGLNREFRHFALGKYKVRLYLDDGSQGRALTAEREVTVWPWRLMILAGAAIIAVLAVMAVLVGKYIRSGGRGRGVKAAVPG